MPKKYYQFPFQPALIIQGKKHPIHKGINEAEAISDHVYLILITRQEEFRSAKEFGCGIWDNELAIPQNMEVNTWQRHLETTIKNSLEHEKRLIKTKVTINLEPVKGTDRPRPDDYKEITVLIEGYMPNMQEPFSFKRTLVFNPLSLSKKSQ